MKILKDVLKRNLPVFLICLIIFFLNFTVFFLYNYSFEPLVYSAVLSTAAIVIVISIQLLTENKKAKERKNLIASILTEWKNLPVPRTEAEIDYEKMIAVLGKKLETLTEEFNEERRDSVDYYTAWVHQIKTPIAVIKLKLSDDTPENRALAGELFRIEQYVDMVLNYIRLGSRTNDLVIKEYPLDDLIKESVRKFAPQFIEKKIRLDYEPSDIKLVTDKKWFLCILDQFISNAVKYTSEGSVTVSVKNHILTVSDTGIGISKEDLPRIFEKGYTGMNGRIGEKSSGIGLYLAKKAADMLALKLTAESTAGKGSSFSLDLNQNNSPDD